MSNFRGQFFHVFGVKQIFFFFENTIASAQKSCLIPFLPWKHEKTRFLGLRRFSNLNVLHKGLLMQDWVFRLGSTANLNFLFLSLFVYLLKNCSSQFFSNWKSAEPVFCCEELSCLPYKNQNKSLNLSFGEGKFKFAVLWGLFIKPFFHWVTFNNNFENMLT